MTKTRAETFSDGVLAIIITIMVLEVHAPVTDEATHELAPSLVAYALSFGVLAVYWYHHHSMFSAVRRVDGGAIWWNTAGLFVLSIVPMLTAWIAHTGFASLPVAIYGATLALASACMYALGRSLSRIRENDALVQFAQRHHARRRFAIVAHSAAVPVAFVTATGACILYALIGAAFVVPDRMLEDSE